MGGKRRRSYRYDRPSQQSLLRVFVGQRIKCRGQWYKVAQENRENGLQMGCWGCAFNEASRREDFVIPVCRCSLTGDKTPVAVWVNDKERDLVYTCHDLHCACTGTQSIIYVKE